ncbi:hypothetical protein BDK51DRAFT_42261 [Blyttiomyces helicus]|uniref:Uncharacterized protein n=1 Tax=Blyttiomyces helicus TaxID=388810 RepID=A0A4P9WMW6_9FUNG|nr:hypothetical protein BDK51DRAFT_42261 [Blyttiomyces helicus]|eukprot:RKO93585.1 hypothetical protein BDK51DRAFT_42261 [Blyttiomyces helicus]
MAITNPLDANEDVQEQLDVSTNPFDPITEPAQHALFDFLAWTATNSSPTSGSSSSPISGSSSSPSHQPTSPTPPSPLTSPLTAVSFGSSTSSASFASSSASPNSTSPRSAAPSALSAPSAPSVLSAQSAPSAGPSGPSMSELLAIMQVMTRQADERAAESRAAAAAADARAAAAAADARADAAAADARAAAAAADSRIAVLEAKVSQLQERMSRTEAFTSSLAKITYELAGEDASRQAQRQVVIGYRQRSASERRTLLPLLEERPLLPRARARSQTRFFY